MAIPLSRFSFYLSREREREREENLPTKDTVLLVFFGIVFRTSLSAWSFNVSIFAVLATHHARGSGFNEYRYDTETHLLL